jgi:hypothetical protein
MGAALLFWNTTCTLLTGADRGEAALGSAERAAGGVRVLLEIADLETSERVVAADRIRQRGGSRAAGSRYCDVYPLAISRQDEVIQTHPRIT